MHNKLQDFYILRLKHSAVFPLVLKILAPVFNIQLSGMEIRIKRWTNRVACIFLYVVEMRENTDQKNSVFGNFSGSVSLIVR